MQEILDAYDEGENLLGYDLIRGQLNPKGVFRLIVMVLIQHEDGDFLLMQRDFTKSWMGGYYDASAMGATMKGETSKEAGIREVFEETGIALDELVLINKRVEPDIGVICHCYRAVTSCAKEGIVLQAGETIAYKWLAPQAFFAFMDSEEAIPLVRERLRPYLDTIKGSL